MSRRSSKNTKDGKGSLVELVVIVVVALGLALGIQQFLVKPFRIPSESMEPTLTVGQRVLVDRVSPRFGAPERGDVVVFKPPRGADSDAPQECAVTRPENQPCREALDERSDTNFIKRVVGVPGDELRVIRGRVELRKNGRWVRQDEPFIEPDEACDTCNLDQPIKVPPDQFFMMGDNRGNSTDSRAWGPVKEEWIIGGAFFTYWPPKRIGTP